MATVQSALLDDRSQLIHCLSKIAERRRRSKTIRVLTHPALTIYPRLVGMAGVSCLVQARTFWGGTMNVVLPEAVSTNIWRYGYFEEDVCLYMLHHLERGMTFVDIGAHVGFFSLLGAYLVQREGRVLSFEPTPTTYQRLTENIRQFSHYSNVHAFNCAAYSEDAELRLFDYGLGDSAYNSIIGSRKMTEHPHGGNPVMVNARKIDHVLIEESVKHVDLIKIDAESSEMHVLTGLQNTLEQYRPDIIMEVGDFGFDGVPMSNEIIRWLLPLGYSPYEICDGQIVRHQLKERYHYGNLLFVAER